MIDTLHVRYGLMNKKIPGLEDLIKSRAKVDSEQAMKTWKERAAALFYADPLLRQFDRHEIRFDIGDRCAIQIIQPAARVNFIGSSDLEVDQDRRLLLKDTLVETVTTKCELRINGRAAANGDLFHVTDSSLHVLVSAVPEQNGKYTVTSEDDYGHDIEEKGIPGLYLRLRRVMWVLCSLHYGAPKPRPMMHLKMP